MEFEFTYWTRRQSAEATLKVRKIDTGWHISHNTLRGDAYPEGAPFLKTNLNQDFVNFPNSMGAYLRFVWEQLDTRNIDKKRAQQMIQEIGDWITACEKSTPTYCIK